MSVSHSMPCEVCGHPFPAGSEDDTICPDCLYGDLGEPDEPQEEDLVTDDHRQFFRFGMSDCRPVVQVPEAEDWRIHVKAYMNRTMYWPNVWFISDHGNAHLLSLEDQ
jgi:hypothetical protein